MNQEEIRKTKIRKKIAEGGPKYVLENLYVNFRRKKDSVDSSQEELIRDTSLRGIEAYLVILDDINGSVFKCSTLKGLFDSFNISENVAWQHAEKNTVNSATVKNLMDFLQRNFMLDPMTVPVTASNMNVFIVSNIYNAEGAGAILNFSVLKELAKNMQTKWLALCPSSKDEWLVAKCDGPDEKDFFSDTVRSVNDSEVIPQNQLADEAFILNVDTRELI